MRHTTVHLAEQPPQRGRVVGQAHTTAELFNDPEVQEEAALHALEQAVLPHLVDLARTWTRLSERYGDGGWRTLILSLNAHLIDNSEVPGVEDQVTITAEVR